MKISRTIRTLKIARVNKVSDDKTWFGYWLGIAQNDSMEIDNTIYKKRINKLINKMLAKKRCLRSLVRAEKELT